MEQITSEASVASTKTTEATKELVANPALDAALETKHNSTPRSPHRATLSRRQALSLKSKRPSKLPQRPLSNT
jgi:hypothetical protein